jgi:molecular chaperone GrpE
MSSNPGNKDAGQSAVEKKDQVKRERNDAQSKVIRHEGEPRVLDMRRLTPEGEPAVEIDQSLPQAPEIEAGADQTIEAGMDQPELAATDEIEQLRARLKESEEKRAEAERQVRDFADRFRLAQSQLKVENEELRARMQRTFDQKLDSSRGSVLASLLETLDNIKRAIAAAEKSQKRAADFEALLDGVRATANLFESKMQSLGLQAMTSVGEQFNPEFHEAVEIVRVPADQDNQVLEEFQTGYKLGDRLLRPARVRVGRAG